jgi:enoyl-CoA hydratase/carnithine racemase
MAEEKPIRLVRESEGHLARIEIRVPPVNVLGAAHMDELASLVEDAGSSRVLVLSGLPRAFSAGVEIAEHVPEAGPIERMLASMGGLLAALIETPAVTVASVSGACLGGGAEIAAACDFVLAAEDARIGFPEIRLGCFPPAAVALLPARIGETRAADWILSGRTFSGTEAAAAGFATRTVPASLLEEETRRLARELLSRGAAGLSAACALLRASRRHALSTNLIRAEDAYRKLEGDPDLARAIRDFRKR